MDIALDNVIKIAKELVGKDKYSAECGGAIPAGSEAVSWRKSAQSALDGIKFNPQGMMADAKGRLTEFWEKLSPATKQTLFNAAVGGLVGGGVAGAAGGMYAAPGEGLSQMVSKALMGGALGAGAAGLGTAGWQAATSGRVLPGEQKGVSPADRMAEGVVGTMVRNPALTAGTGLGLYSGYKGIEKIQAGLESQAARQAIESALFTRSGGDPNILKQLAERAGLVGKEVAGSNLLTRGGIGLLGLPAGVGMGWLVDRYLKGHND
jgi:hypothetical protein